MIFHSNEIDRATVYLNKLFERKRSVKIELITQSKSVSQLGYCWLCFTHVGFETGNNKDDIYQLCLQKFPVHKSIEINGEITLISVTLSGMDKEMTSAFIDQFVVFFRQEGFDIPNPEDKKCLEMYQYYKEKGIL